ncbi:MAG TPA: PEPxxWA-CTERM sorting domain-containing protein [Caulobacteraceae bacterium]|jgi:hypothetical protein|nr:PEPxxWA-CTERM sorting domain-containing protein [Caulobacteraceae bacterium]
MLYKWSAGLRRVRTIGLLATAGAFSALGGANAATPAYYLFSGDSANGVAIVDGAVTETFNTFYLGYPVAITSTIWLGGRDNGGGAQYTLNGTPTGAASPGGALISQILDGTTSGVNNYGVTCCGSNAVTIANLDWSNQSILFNIPDGGDGIAYDTADNTLFVSDFSNDVTQYSLTGQALSQFSTTDNIVGLAYDQSSNTIWGWDRAASSLDQYSLSGTLLQSQYVDVNADGIDNPFGGEMPILSAAPEPASWAMMVLGVGLLGAALRRDRLSDKRLATRAA